MVYKIVNVRGHYEVYLIRNGEFICAGDTPSEAAREAEKCLAEREV